MPASEEVHAYLISIGYVARVREEKSAREVGKRHARTLESPDGK